MTWESGYKKMVLGINSEIVVKWLHSIGTSYSSSSNLVAKCKKLLAKEWEIRVHHIYREQNRAADFLSSAALDYDSGWITIEVPPARLKEIMGEDRLGMSFSRRVPIR